MNEINEIWTPIEGYETRYAISNFGAVKSIKTNKLLKQEIRRDYYSVQLFDGHNYKHQSIHRLVAKHFIDNPQHFLYVNHKDENKLNNNVNNLEWCTHSYNVNYGSAIERSKEKRSSKVHQFDKNGVLINTFDSIADAERITGIFNPNIVKCCKGKRKSAGKFVWRYA